LQKNADYHSATNKDQEEEDDKETEKTSVDKKEEEAIGETSKVQETMDPPSTHEPQKSQDKNQPMNHKSTHCGQ
jgi:hypothetical protein